MIFQVESSFLVLKLWQILGLLTPLWWVINHSHCCTCSLLVTLYPLEASVRAVSEGTTGSSPLTHSAMKRLLWEGTLLISVLGTLHGMTSNCNSSEQFTISIILGWCFSFWALSWAWGDDNHVSGVCFQWLDWMYYHLWPWHLRQPTTRMLIITGCTHQSTYNKTSFLQYSSPFVCNGPKDQTPKKGTVLFKNRFLFQGSGSN